MSDSHNPFSIEETSWLDQDDMRLFGQEILSFTPTERGLISEVIEIIDGTEKHPESLGTPSTFIDYKTILSQAYAIENNLYVPVTKKNRDAIRKYLKNQSPREITPKIVPRNLEIIVTFNQFSIENLRIFLKNILGYLNCTTPQQLECITNLSKQIIEHSILTPDPKDSVLLKSILYFSKSRNTVSKYIALFYQAEIRQNCLYIPTEDEKLAQALVVMIKLKEASFSLGIPNVKKDKQNSFVIVEFNTFSLKNLHFFLGHIFSNLDDRVIDYLSLIHSLVEKIVEQSAIPACPDYSIEDNATLPILPILYMEEPTAAQPPRPETPQTSYRFFQLPQNPDPASVPQQPSALPTEPSLPSANKQGSHIVPEIIEIIDDTEKEPARLGLSKFKSRSCQPSIDYKTVFPQAYVIENKLYIPVIKENHRAIFQYLKKQSPQEITPTIVVRHLEIIVTFNEFSIENLSIFLKKILSYLAGKDPEYLACITNLSKQIIEQSILTPDPKDSILLKSILRYAKYRNTVSEYIALFFQADIRQNHLYIPIKNEKLAQTLFKMMWSKVAFFDLRNLEIIKDEKNLFVIVEFNELSLANLHFFLGHIFSNLDHRVIDYLSLIHSLVEKIAEQSLEAQYPGPETPQTSDRISSRFFQLPWNTDPASVPQQPPAVVPTEPSSPPAKRPRLDNV